MQNSTAVSQFLDENQYSENSIRRYEFVFGRTFVSTGGLQTTEEFCSSLNLKPGEIVLDVGVGAGGSALYMAKKYGVHVKGVDLSSNMLNIAEKYKEELPKDVQSRLQFVKLDVTTVEFPNNSFDVIYSRDTLMHISDKQTLFKKFYQWLRPGGRLFITDYTRGEDENTYSAEFKDYLANRGYYTLPVTTYGSILQKAGFQNISANDETKLFVEILEIELDRLRTNKVEFLKRFTPKDYSDLEDGWTAKLRRCGNTGKGEQRWGLFKATKQ